MMELKCRSKAIFLKNPNIWPRVNLKNVLVISYLHGQTWKVCLVTPPLLHQLSQCMTPVQLNAVKVFIEHGIILKNNPRTIIKTIKCW